MNPLDKSHSKETKRRSVVIKSSCKKSYSIFLEKLLDAKVGYFFTEGMMHQCTYRPVQPSSLASILYKQLQLPLRSARYFNLRCFRSSYLSPTMILPVMFLVVQKSKERRRVTNTKFPIKLSLNRLQSRYTRNIYQLINKSINHPLNQKVSQPALQPFKIYNS